MPLSQVQKENVRRKHASIAAIRAANPSATSLDIARQLGIPSPTVRKYLCEPTRIGDETLPPVDPAYASRGDGQLAAERVLESTPSETKKTLEEVLAEGKVDLTQWQVARWTLNKWDTAAAEGEVKTLWQVKIYLIPHPERVKINALKDLIEELKVEAKRTIPAKVPVLQTKRIPVADPVLLEISPFDLHHGKLSWAQETGVPYDAKISESLFLQAIETLWLRASAFPVRRVLLVLGNDFFTVDSSRDETFAGTPQHVDSRFAKNFTSGWRMMRQGVEYLRARCPGGVDVLIVPGNHDTDTMYCAGEVLVALYEHTDDVRVDNSPSMRKYVRYGCNLLAFTHGDREKHAQLPLIMAQERAKDWSETTTREVHIGHFHHAKSTSFVSGSEHNSIRVRILPSLSAADSWHHSHGYLAKRAAEAYLWGEKSGYLGHLSWSP